MWKSLFKCSKHEQYSYAVFDSVAELDMNDWDSVNSKNNIYLSSKYLNAFEKGMQDNYSFRYLFFYDKSNKIVGICYLQIVAFKPVELLQEKIPCSIADKVKSLIQEKELNLLICGNLFACGENGFAHTNDISTEKYIDILSNALGDLSKNEDKKISFLLFKEFWQENFKISKNLKKQSYKDFSIDDNMVLGVEKDWDSFEDYLNAMKTKYRTRAKNVFKSSKNIIVKDFTFDEIAASQERIESMYLEVLSKADYNLGTLNAESFLELKKELGDQFIVKGYFLEEKLIGFSSAFAFNGTIDANFVGIDYTYNKEYKTYQRMLYDFVDLAIQRNTYELRFGRTAETIKSVVGAKPVAMKLYAKHRRSLSTSLLGIVLNSISPNEFEIRTPFKN